VRSLFYNLPARRKFLRSENTESRNIEHQIHLQAIGHPQIGFTLVRDDRLVFQLPATATLNDRIRDLYGQSLLERLIEISGNASSKIQTSGFIGQAGLSRQTRAQQLFFVNGRAIESGLITAAVREGYHTALMKGQYPVTFLFLTLNSSAVDVNVHPAKREVRFRDPTAVRDAIVHSVRQTLEGGRIEWQEKFRAPVSSSLTEIKIAAPAMAQPQLEAAVGPENVGGHYRPAEFAPPPRFVPKDRRESAAAGVDPSTTGRTATAPQQFQIIGVLNKLYVLMENADGLVLVDQHAAHERILFEELRRRMEEQGVPAQRLLLPQTIDLPPRDADWIERNISILQKMGIGIESFGPNTFKIDSLPSFLNVSDPTQFMRKVIDDLKSASNSSSAMRLGEEMIAKTVCRHAVKANDPLRYLEVEKLVQDLLECDLPYCCPHGRPTMIQISLAELEKKFGRKV
jgi:DNA mismatch repair protein MutL